MNRLELIAKLAGKKATVAPVKALGLSAAKTGQTTVKPHANRAPSRGNVYARCFGCYQDGRVRAGVAVAPVNGWRPKFRHGAHWLTRVAEKLRK